MASNSFGQIFRITTFGESHGSGIGVVIDGCPAGVSFDEHQVNEQLALRRPGNSAFTSPRREDDLAEILSGVFEGKTTGMPVTIFIRNKDADSSQYENVKEIYRPGHANFTYLKKYGAFDFRGGGRASARETAARVAAGALARNLLKMYGIECTAFILEIGGVVMPDPDLSKLNILRAHTYASPVYCPDKNATSQMIEKIDLIKKSHDSIGGIVACVAHVPAGLGDPIYCKLEAMLAFAMLSLPASKGFEIGCGFNAARMKGSEHNDAFDIDSQGQVYTPTNFSGGTLGGISTGAPLFFKVAFKATSSIKKPQQTVNLNGEKTVFQMPENGRHDPCVAIRAVPVVEAMTALVLADSVLMNRNSQS